MDQLPQEIKKNVFYFCDDKTRRIARLTCLEWFNIIDYRDFKLYFTTKSSWPKIVDRLSQYAKPITLCLHKNIINKLSDINEHLLRLTNLASWRIDDIDKSTDLEWLKLTSLSNLQAIKTPNTPIDLLLRLNHLTDFHESRSKIAFNDRLAQSIRKWTNLASCKLFKAIEGQDNLFQSYHTKLTHLQLNVTKSRNSVVENYLKNLCNLRDLSIFVDVLSARDAISLRHLTALEKLSLDGLTFHELRSTRLTKLTMYGLEEKFFEKELDYLQYIKCLDFEVRFSGMHETEDSVESDNENDEIEEHRFEWLTALTALENLYANPLQNTALSFVAVPSLTQLEIHIRAGDPDLSRLSQFTALEKLIISSDYPRDLSHISALTRLTTLNVHFGDPDGHNEIPFDLAILPNLVNLRLSYCTARLSRFSKLQSLEISKAPDWLTRLSNLTHLEILDSFRSKFAAKSFLADLRLLTSLKAIKLLAPVIGTYDCQYFTPLTALEHLELFELENEISYEHLAGLTRLTSLHTTCGLMSPKIFKLPKSIQELWLGFGNSVGPDFEEKLKLHLPKLHRAYFRY